MNDSEVNIKPGTLQSKVWAVLKDKEWHCRKCVYEHIGSGQPAGGGGIQGIKRKGVAIESEQRHCNLCDKKTHHDRWTGEIQASVTNVRISDATKDRILKLLGNKDIVEQRERASNEFVIDHKFPQIRLGGPESQYDDSITDTELIQKFQLLKKEPNGNHNQLKSRACETCVKTKKRGKPFGIDFYYQGTEDWTHPFEKGFEAEDGCIGCGWYDFATWREELNEALKSETIKECALSEKVQDSTLGNGNRLSKLHSDGSSEEKR